MVRNKEGEDYGVVVRNKGGEDCGVVVRNEGGEDCGVKMIYVRFVREKKESGRGDCEICY